MSDKNTRLDKLEKHTGGTDPELDFSDITDAELIELERLVRKAIDEKKDRCNFRKLTKPERIELDRIAGKLKIKG